MEKSKKPKYLNIKIIILIRIIIIFKNICSMFNDETKNNNFHTINIK